MKKYKIFVWIFVLLFSLSIAQAITENNEKYLNRLYEKATIATQNYQDYSVEKSATGMEKELGKKFNDFTVEEKANAWTQYYMDLRGIITKLRTDYFEVIKIALDEEKESITKITDSREKSIAESNFKRYNRLYSAAKEGVEKTSLSVRDKVSQFEIKDGGDGSLNGIAKGLLGRRINFKKPEISVDKYDDVKIQITAEAEKKGGGIMDIITAPLNFILPDKWEIKKENTDKWFGWVDYLDPRYHWNQGWWPNRIVMILIVITLVSLTSKKRRNAVKEFFSHIPVVGGFIGKMVTLPANILVFLNWIRKQLIWLKFITNIPNAGLCLLSPERWTVGWKEKKNIWDFTFVNIMRGFVAMWRTLTYVEHWTYKKLPTHKQVEELGLEISKRVEAIKRLDDIIGALNGEVQRLNVELQKQIGTNNDLRIKMIEILTNISRGQNPQQPPNQNPPQGGQP
jgi:hypothetical protein